MSLIAVTNGYQIRCGHDPSDTVEAFDQISKRLKATLQSRWSIPPGDVLTRLNPSGAATSPRKIEIVIGGVVPRNVALNKQVAREMALVIGSEMTRIFSCQRCRSHPREFHCEFVMPDGEWLAVTGEIPEETIEQQRAKAEAEAEKATVA